MCYYCEQQSYVLPLFDGTDPRGWIIKARAYFEFIHELDVDRIKLAGRHFQGKTSTRYKWFYQKRNENVGSLQIVESFMYQTIALGR